MTDHSNGSFAYYPDSTAGTNEIGYDDDKDDATVIVKMNDGEGLLDREVEYFAESPKGLRHLSSFIQTLTLETIKVSEHTKKEKERLLPPLSLFKATPRNMTRFMFRVGCLFDALGKYLTHCILLAYHDAI